MSYQSSRLPALGLLILLAGMLVHSAAWCGDEELVGKKAADLQGDFAVDGKPISLADLKGKIVVLEFWAPASGPCRGMFPALADWQKKFGGKGLAVVGVTTYYKKFTFNKNIGQIKELALGNVLSKKDEQEMLKQFVEHYDLKYKVMALSQTEWEKACRDYHVERIPTTVLIDEKGVVKMARSGSGTKNTKELETTIEKLISDKAANDEK